MCLSIQERLKALQDPVYQQFQSKLMPTIDPGRVLGVRMPALRRLARELRGSCQAEDFLQTLPHFFYEENNLHGLLICQKSSYPQTIAALEVFLPQVDNWATCDLLHPKAFSSHPSDLPRQVQLWLASSHPYTVRFGIGVLMNYYLEEMFLPCYPQWVASVTSEEYYVRMMAAWYFATALAKQPETILPYLLEDRLDPWVHNRTIQKAIESFRISPEQKEQLRRLRRKIKA